MLSLLSLVLPIHSNDGQNHDNWFTGHNPNLKIADSVLLVSKDLTLKSSVLYQLIQTVITNEYQEIHYITSEEINAIPKPVNQMPTIGLTNGSLLELLKIYYLSSYDSLVNHLLGIQSTQMCPIVIIVDDISFYVKEFNSRIPRQVSNQSFIKRHKTYQKDAKQLMAQLSALLISTANNCQQKLNQKCLAVMGYDIPYDAINSDDQQMAESIGHRFFTHIWSLRTTRSCNIEVGYQMDCQSSDGQFRVDLISNNKRIFLDKIFKKNN